jgi:hypothetical protein
MPRCRRAECARRARRRAEPRELAPLRHPLYSPATRAPKKLARSCRAMDGRVHASAVAARAGFQKHNQPLTTSLCATPADACTSPSMARRDRADFFGARVAGLHGGYRRGANSRGSARRRARRAHSARRQRGICPFSGFHTQIPRQSGVTKTRSFLGSKNGHRF